MKNLYGSLFLLLSLYSFAQPANISRLVAGIPVNYSEDSVGNYVLPDVLKLQNGNLVKDARTWTDKRRPEIVKLFEEHQFGKMPPRPKELRFDVFDKGTEVLNGKAIRRQVRIYFTKDTAANKMDLVFYVPKTSRPSPLLLIINFSANASAIDDPGIRPGEIWGRDGKKIPATQGRSFGKINVDTFISQGIGIATVYYGDIEPDFRAGVKYGIRGHYLKPGETYPADDEWGAISAWAWGLSRAMDYFETDDLVDAKRIALQGTSRLGKTVLWAGAHDPRFKMVIASCSGEGGAALSRRNYGENIKHMTDTSRYFYQFAAQWHKYSDDFDLSPVEAHMLVSLMAPRPLLLQTGDTDYWSDPKGEFLSALAAAPVYKLFGKDVPATDVMPKAGDTSNLKTLGYYMHSGGHGTVPSDWGVFIQYMKKYL